LEKQCVEETIVCDGAYPKKSTPMNQNYALFFAKQLSIAVWLRIPRIYFSGAPLIRYKTCRNLRLIVRLNVALILTLMETNFSRKFFKRTAWRHVFT